MNAHARYSPAGVRDLLQTHGLAASKARGQNFLFDRGCIDACLQHLGVHSETDVLEIGPGLGHTTLRLLETGARVTAVEIDSGFLPVLHALEVAGNRPAIVHADATTIDLQHLYPKNETPLVIGNLPYSHASALLFHMLRFKHRVSRMGFLVQLEFAQRMCAAPGSRVYGRLTVMVGTQCRPTIARRVGPSVFYPRPRVESAFILLAPLPPDQMPPILDYRLLEDLVRHAFLARRKTLQNALAPWCKRLGYSNQTLQQTAETCHIALSDRAERLSPENYVRWANALYRANQDTPSATQSTPNRN